MADFLSTVDTDAGPREPIPVTLVSAGAEVALGGLPSSLGQKTSAQSLSIVPASDSTFTTQTVGRASLTTGQVTVATTAGGTLIVPARAGRSGVIITQVGTTDVYLGNSGVTTATGQLLAGTKGTSVTLAFTGAVYGITASGTQSVTFTEIY